MCYFVTIGVPERHAGRIREAFSRGYQLDETKNASVLAAFPPHCAARLLTSGMCSCDLYARPRSPLSGDREQRLRRKYAKRGWSEAKIERAIAEAGVEEQVAMSFSGLAPAVVEGLQALCASAGKAAVVVHWYRGDTETARLSLRQQTCELAEFPECAGRLKEDEALIVTRGPEP